MAKLIKNTIDVLLIVAIIVLAAYFVLRKMNFLTIYSVKTGSMEDNIHVNDYIMIVNKDDYNIGDIVTFKKEGGYITHRIISKNGDTITTKGDANNIQDDNISKSDIVGKVIIIGGILNILINYKFTIIGLLLTLYLVSCYFTEMNEKYENADEINFDIGDEEEIDETAKFKEKVLEEIKPEEEDKVQKEVKPEEKIEDKIQEEVKLVEKKGNKVQDKKVKQKKKKTEVKTKPKKKKENNKAKETKFTDKTKVKKEMKPKKKGNKKVRQKKNETKK